MLGPDDFIDVNNPHVTLFVCFRLLYCLEVIQCSCLLQILRGHLSGLMCIQLHFPHISRKQLLSHVKAAACIVPRQLLIPHRFLLSSFSSMDSDKPAGLS